MFGFDMGAWQVKKVQGVDLDSFEGIGHMVHGII